MYVNKVPAATGRCLNKIVDDVASPSATTDVDLQTAMKGPPGAVAKEHERDKFARTTDANVAALKTGLSMCRSRSTRTLSLWPMGPRMGKKKKGTLHQEDEPEVNRESFDVDKELERLHGLRDGTYVECAGGVPFLARAAGRQCCQCASSSNLGSADSHCGSS